MLPIPESLSLSGNVAIVTGCGSESGIGFSIAQHLGQLGCALIITSTSDRIKDRVKQLRAVGIQAFGIACDLCEETNGRKVVELALEKFGHCEILVNNAGMTSLSFEVVTTGTAESGDILSMDLATWRRCHTRNVITLLSNTNQCST